MPANAPASRLALVPCAALLLATACGGSSAGDGAARSTATQAAAAPLTDPATRALCEAAVERTRHRVRYDGAYRSIAYPGGDVAPDRGVCTDVVIRSYRAAFGLDLQRLVHEDMRAEFAAYPKRWGLTRPDPNIDHRRVPNLETFWRRQGGALPVSREAEDYAPGDLVTWDVAGRPHVGVVVDRRSPRSGRWMIVHNIGAGPRLEDCLFDWPITGRYRWLPSDEREDIRAE